MEAIIILIAFLFVALTIVICIYATQNNKNNNQETSNPGGCCSPAKDPYRNNGDKQEPQPEDKEVVESTN